MSSYTAIVLARNSVTAINSGIAVARYARNLLNHQTRLLSSSADNMKDAFDSFEGPTVQSSTKVNATNVPVGPSTGRLFSSLASLDISSLDMPSDSIMQSFSNRPFSEHYPSEDIDNDDDNEEISMRELHALASQPCTPLTVVDMYKYASGNVRSKNYYPQRLRNAIFLHKELQIRIAQRAIDLLNLPHGLSKTTHVQEIAHVYLRYLRLFQDCPSPTNNEEELAFTDMLRIMVLDRSSIPMAIARGIVSLKDKRKEELDIQGIQELENALYRFFNARVGLRLLTEHHILSCAERQEENDGVRLRQTCLENVPLRREDEALLGCVKANCNPATEVQRVASQVMSYCRECYGVAPEIEILDSTPEQYSNADFTFVPHHLQFMLVELLRNSCRSVVKRYMEGEQDNTSNATLPPIRVVIVKGAEDVTIKIADRGGGVPRSAIDRMWNFTHSTLSDEVESNENSKHTETDGCAGKSNSRGFGLPLARIYARYLGGELTVKSMEGYGVDAYLYLPMLGDAGENLPPKRVLLSPGHADSIYDGNRGKVEQSSSLNIGGDEPWAGGERHFSTSSLAQLRRYEL